MANLLLSDNNWEDLAGNSPPSLGVSFSSGNWTWNNLPGSYVSEVGILYIDTTQIGDTINATVVYTPNDNNWPIEIHLLDGDYLLAGWQFIPENNTGQISYTLSESYENLKLTAVALNGSYDSGGSVVLTPIANVNKIYTSISNWNTFLEDGDVCSADLVAENFVLTSAIATLYDTLTFDWIEGSCLITGIEPTGTIVDVEDITNISTVGIQIDDTYRPTLTIEAPSDSILETATNTQLIVIVLTGTVDINGDEKPVTWFIKMGGQQVVESGLWGVYFEYDGGEGEG